MKGISQKLILISFILALLAAISVFMYLKSLEKPVEIIKNTSIIVATENIPARTLIDKKMLTEIEVSDSTIFNGYIRNSSDIVGKYTKDTILKNEGFVKEKLLSEDSNDLGLKLKKDHRAITIRVNGEAGVAYLLKPADFVDVLVYLSEKKDADKVIRPDISKVILQNIEIMAIDTKLTREEVTVPTNEKSKDKEETPTTFLVTLSVPTKDIEKLALAESIGSLKLVLRPLKTDETNETDGTVWEELLGDINTNNTPLQQEKTVKPIEENKTIEESNTTVEGTNSSNNTNYIVKKGDTLRSISKALYGDSSKYTLIRDANNIENENIIITGQSLTIPNK
jgi:pilus assembly protein CpaB